MFPNFVNNSYSLCSELPFKPLWLGLHINISLYTRERRSNIYLRNDILGSCPALWVNNKILLMASTDEQPTSSTDHLEQGPYILAGEPMQPTDKPVEPSEELATSNMVHTQLNPP